MSYKKSLLVLACIVTPVGLAALILEPGWVSGFLVLVALMAWAFYSLAKEPHLMADTNRILVEKEEDRHGIPGYEKSGVEIRGCYNCFYSKDFDNDTYVKCNKFSKNVFRNHICDLYKE